MYFSVISFQVFLNFHIWAFSENVQCFVGAMFNVSSFKQDQELQVSSLNNLSRLISAWMHGVKVGPGPWDPGPGTPLKV